ncbi:MAG: hypothetical protein WD512_02615 [Candidatus Paceibacterota bacterium]
MKAILYVNSGEVLRNADIECIFEYSETMDDEKLENTICQYIRDNLDSFDEMLIATFPCVYDVILNDDDRRFPTLQNKMLDAGLIAILKADKKKSSKDKENNANNYNDNGNANANDNDSGDGSENKSVSDNENQSESKNESDNDDESVSKNESDNDDESGRNSPALEDYWYRKCWNTKGKQYVNLLKKCIRDKEVDLSEISNFLFTTHFCNGTGSYYMYCASIHNLDNRKVYSLLAK